MITENTVKGQVTFDLGIGTLSSNKELFIHAVCYTASYQQKGTIQIREKNGQGDWQSFGFGPESSGGYAELLNKSYPVEDDTFYEVKVTIENDRGRGQWGPSTVMPPAQLSTGNYHEKVVTSEDLKNPDDVNDTVVRLVWFTEPGK